MVSDSTELMTITREQHTNLMMLAESNRQMAAMLQQMGAALSALNSRLARMEKVFDTKVTIDSRQAKALQKAVRERAKALCEKHELSYARDGKTVRAAINRTVLSQYGVEDAHDIPASYYDLALTLIQGWTSFQLIRQIREANEK